ncbi:MAG: hypothetical protein PWR10_1774 [Halanaerobiales bacterium]|nr:hypothetical protein [Halanaerobiales bacterium]
MIVIENIKDAPVGLFWETSLRDIGCLTVYFDGKARLNIKKGDALSVTFGPAGNMQRLRKYTVWRVRQGERIEIIALEFGPEWQAKARAIYPGPRQAAISNLLSKKGESPGQMAVDGGNKTYAQNESDIAFLYRLAGNTPVWRDGQGAINVAYPPDVKVQQVIDYKPSAMAGRKYIATGLTPDGMAFEISAGEGVETRIAEVFHSPAEASEYLQRLAIADPKGKLQCVGQAGLRAGCNVILPEGSKHRVTKCKHEVKHESWTITAYLTAYLN